MSDKAAVEIATIKVQKTFDKKYEKSLQPIIKAAAESAVAGSSAMQKASAANPARFSIDIAIISLTCETAGSSAKLAIKVSITISEKDSMFGFLTGGAAMDGANPKKLDHDVKLLVEDVIADLIKGKANKAVQERARKK